MKNAILSLSMLVTVASCSLLGRSEVSDTDMLITLPDGVTIDYNRQKGEAVITNVVEEPCEKVEE